MFYEFIPSCFSAATLEYRSNKPSRIEASTSQIVVIVNPPSHLSGFQIETVVRCIVFEGHHQQLWKQEEITN